MEDDRDEDTRTRLLRAAYHVLCDHGYAEFSLRKVAAEAGMSRGLVHYHYESKTDLVVSLLDHMVGRFEDRFRDPPDGHALDRLEAVLEWVAFGPELFGRSGTDYFTAIFELRARAPYESAVRERLTRNYETVRDRVADVLRRGIDEGELVPVDPRRTATTLVVAIDGARNAELTLAVDGAVETTLDGIDRFVFESLRRS